MARPVEYFDQDLELLMKCTLMHESDGAGLAATQVGSILLVLSSYISRDEESNSRFGWGQERIWQSLIQGLSARPKNRSEGCLSFPDVYIKVKDLHGLK